MPDENSTLRALLDGSQTKPGQYKAKCPAHDDSNPSLTVTVVDNGKILLKCHAGCTNDEVCKAMGKTTADLFRGKSTPKPTPKPTPKAPPKPQRAPAPIPEAERAEAWAFAKKMQSSFTGFKLTTIYAYRNANGSVWSWRARYEHESEPKAVKHFHHDGTKWIAKMAPHPRAGRPLYNLPEVLATTGPVFIVEGEKCVDALHAIGIAATTSGASDTANGADWSPLQGRSVVIWPDNDDSGDKYADAVAAKLAPLGCAVSRVDVAALDLPIKGDAAVWLAKNPKADAVLKLPTIVETPHSAVTLVRASDVEAKAVDWLWPGYLPRSMLTILAGNGGTGKTTIALSIAAAISTGGKLPDGTKASRGSVLIWSGEDAIAETLVPRLQAAGADLDRVLIVGAPDGEVFDPATNMPALRQQAAQFHDLALVILDPLVSAVLGDSHKNAEVRRGLQPVLDLAAQANAAVIGITHYAKNTAGRSTNERVIGSVAFSAVARVVLATAMGQDGDGRIVRSKNNLGQTGDGFAYGIEVIKTKIDGVATEVSRIKWGEPLYGFADLLLAELESKRSPLDEATDWLTAALHDGPVTVKDLQVQADDDGIAWRTVERAKKASNVVAKRVGETGKARGIGKWTWHLPKAPKCFG